MKDILKKTATEMSDPIIPGSEKQNFDFRTGYGFVNASAAFEELLSRKGYRNSTHQGSGTRAGRNLRTGYHKTLA
jgi:hypothetical protein